ncbi:hypothetical protein CPB83DRAFT_850012 [Crepidotus variabilis]|uniref:Uncharacterized protein n=1 Tax=Crepidotus variabilis TaxID=179855 RepID=A0A9P6EL09_9AGAR|nr:hypothetical protein CPB83DRAFT_850012 [Crepidotus variabilis]
MPISGLSSTIGTVADRLKPHKAEAVQRVRTNALGLVTTLLLSFLLPLPSVPTALRALLSSNQHQRWTADWIWQWVCMLETALVVLLAYNVLEASYAIQYPRAPPPAVVSPLKPKATVAATPKKSFKILSPNTSPQVQKPFAFSPQASASRSFASASMALSSTPGANRSTTYAQSPIDTPSRVLNYTPILNSSTNTQASSTSDYLQTPSPVISAYRGKHSGADVGRALDGSYLSRLMPEVESDED